MRRLASYIFVFVFVMIGIGQAMLLVEACTPKAVDCRVEFLKMAEAGVDGAK